ncbi:uncharacterized protein K441DRAFT_658361 [Cenococcum geophilum 1.58]|uniref:uncharacterized protein n=1 Tax=Cenococcum geophilum 1.58 TaxID=794803 RepID=UPI00358F18D2|nr:hypothetical protein K441DRAFT_658361 [Cenococcum geophilum 1.58]
MTFIFGFSVLQQGLAFPPPPTSLPSYTRALALAPSTGDMLLALNSLAQVTGQIMLGHFSDTMGIHIPHTIAWLVSGLAVLLLWGPATGLGSLAAFAALWGRVCWPVQRVVDENCCGNERARGGCGGCNYDAVFLVQL